MIANKDEDYGKIEQRDRFSINNSSKKAKNFKNQNIHLSTNNQNFHPKQNGKNASSTQNNTFKNNTKNESNASKVPNSNSNSEKKYDNPKKYTYIPFKAAKLAEERIKLPIYKERANIIKEIKKNAVTIIVSETGSGKSTQIPQYLMEENLVNNSDGAVAITQPRRMAATTLANRVSQEVGCALGDKVGYSVRFEHNSNSNTLIKYLTDGMLLRELVKDKYLLNYKYVVLDEAHERTIRNDFLLGRLKETLKYRNEHLNKEFHLIIMSATLDTKQFSAFFNNAPIVKVKGRGHPVEILYACDNQLDYIESAAEVAYLIHNTNIEEIDNNGIAHFNKKDILVFLPGEDEINSCKELIESYIKQDTHIGISKLVICPLYASLPDEEQKKALRPLEDNSCRKLILATNVAETSLTIPGVYYVIDTGVAKFRSYNPNTGLESLLVQNISKSGAAQRTGRAGREGPGVCYRLYTKESYMSLNETDVPEIKRSNLESSLLLLIASGIEKIESFEFLDPPTLAALSKALTNLISLNAIDSNHNLTELGQKMAKFPLMPQYSKALLESIELKCTKEIILIISALSVDSLFFTPKDSREEAEERRKRFINPYSDHLTYLNVLHEYIKEKTNKREFCKAHFLNYKNIEQALKIQKQLIDLCKSADLDTNVSCKENDTLIKCLLKGSFMKVAILDPKTNAYKVAGFSEKIKIHPSSVVSEKKVPAILYNELVSTSKHYLRSVSSIEYEWFLEATTGIRKRNRDQ